MERTADTLENCVTVLEEKSCEKQTARSDTELCTLYSALKYRVEVDQHGTRRYYNAAGRLHRTDGPAIEWYDGDLEWFHNGKRHRTDGPAIVRVDGTLAWWINGKSYTQQEYHAQLKTLEQTP